MVQWPRARGVALGRGLPPPAQLVPDGKVQSHVPALEGYEAWQDGGRTNQRKKTT